MTELVDQSCCAVNTCLNYFASFRPRDIRQILDFLGVHHCEVLFGILAFVLFQFTKFTAILLLAVFLAYCIFYWWDTFFPGLSQRESGSSRRDQYAPSYLASFPNTTEKAEYRDELTNARLPPFYGTTSTEPSPGQPLNPQQEIDIRPIKLTNGSTDDLSIPTGIMNKPGDRSTQQVSESSGPDGFQMIPRSYVDARDPSKSSATADRHTPAPRMKEERGNNAVLEITGPASRDDNIPMKPSSA
ncbi:GL13447 [Drosophila persimilis]|uniref:GL13447 n=1 Tax=Drosophila persimilis TaxID=7234 RepID=B4GNP8_DROPE|nr:GL13447 [Drosophila persimilis]